MSGNQLLQKIPVVVQSRDGIHRQSQQPGRRMSWVRRLSQAAAILFIILIPLIGLFRIDVSAGFIILDRQIWFSDFYLVFGFWLSVACLLVLLYSTVGTSFCGWICPQNTLSAWANRMTMRALGKRAVVDWENMGTSRVSGGKNKPVNWFMLGTKLLLISMVVALVPLLYFYPPGAVWSFITFQYDTRLAGSLHWVYTLFVFMVFANLAVIRYYMCRYMCIYRIWQFLFKTRQTLHIEYDASRAEECAKCSYCVTNCPVGIDPRNTAVYDSCTNCGACITACDSLHAKDDTPGLLRFKFGERPDIEAHNRQNLATLGQRIRWVLPAFVIGVSLFSWGVWSYDTYNLSVYRAETRHGAEINDYRINIASKLYKPGAVELRVEGLPKGSYALSSERVNFQSVGRRNVQLHINKDLSDGVYPFTVYAESESGWHSQFRLQHVATKS